MQSKISVETRPTKGYHGQTEAASSLALRYVKLKQQQDALDAELAKVRGLMLLNPNIPSPQSSSADETSLNSIKKEIVSLKPEMPSSKSKDKLSHATKSKSTSLPCNESKGILGLYRRTSSLFSRKSEPIIESYEEINDANGQVKEISSQSSCGGTQVPTSDFVKNLRGQVNILNLKLLETEKHLEEIQSSFSIELDSLKKENFILRQSIAMHKERLDRVNGEKEALSLAAEQTSENAFNFSNVKVCQNVAKPPQTNSLLLRRAAPQSGHVTSVLGPHTSILSRSLSERSKSPNISFSFESLKNSFINSCANEIAAESEAHDFNLHERDPLFLASVSSPKLTTTSLQSNKVIPTSNIRPCKHGDVDEYESASPKGSYWQDPSSKRRGTRKSLSASMYLLSS